MEFLSPKKKIRETNFFGPKKSSVEWTDLIDSFVLRCLNFLKYLVSTRVYVHVENETPHDELLQLSPGRRAIIILFVVQRTPRLVLAYERAALTTTLMKCQYQELAVLLIELKQISLAAKPIRSTEIVEFSQNIPETNSEQFKEGVSSKVSQVIGCLYTRLLSKT